MSRLSWIRSPTITCRQPRDYGAFPGHTGITRVLQYDREACSRPCKSCLCFARFKRAPFTKKKTRTSGWQSGQRLVPRRASTQDRRFPLVRSGFFSQIPPCLESERPPLPTSAPAPLRLDILLVLARTARRGFPSTRDIDQAGSGPEFELDEAALRFHFHRVGAKALRRQPGPPGLNPRPISSRSPGPRLFCFAFRGRRPAELPARRLRHLPQRPNRPCAPPPLPPALNKLIYETERHEHTRGGTGRGTGSSRSSVMVGIGKTSVPRSLLDTPLAAFAVQVILRRFSGGTDRMPGWYRAHENCVFRPWD